MAGKMEHDDGAAVGGSRIASGRPLIDYYERIAEASHRMQAAADAGDWPQVEQIGAQCEGLIGALRQAAKVDALNGAERDRRLQLLRDILRDDARIRACAEPWLRNLEQFLS
jgi:flagellar protein FliT